MDSTEEKIVKTLQKEYEDLSIDEILKRMSKITLKIIFQTNRNKESGYNNWYVVNEPEMRNKLQKNKRIVQQLTNKYGCRKSDLTYDKWKELTDKYLKKKWESLPDKVKEKWI